LRNQEGFVDQEEKVKEEKLTAVNTEFVETKRNSMGTILLIIIILLLVGALPTWPYSSGWGYYPTGGLGLIFIILLVLVLLGRI